MAGDLRSFGAKASDPLVLYRSCPESEHDFVRYQRQLFKGRTLSSRNGSEVPEPTEVGPLRR